MMRENAIHEGYVFNTGEGVMADSPVANIETMMRAVIAHSGG
jgi:uroporphyrinogen-III decarboxylase